MSSSLYVVKTNLMSRIKTCADCKYYVSSNRKCAKFVYINIVTAERVLLDAKVMRSETSFCGFGAVHYEYNSKKNSTNTMAITNDLNKSLDPLDLSCENCEPVD